MRKICYYPELTSVTGSITAALMLAQLEFWFNRMEGKTFYKFLEPCHHELYKTGSSWQEELGMSALEIRSAFKRIGVMYKSKRSFEESNDRFQGKLYAAYYDRIRRTTHYFRNTEKVDLLFKEIEAVEGRDLGADEREIKECVNQIAEVPEGVEMATGNIENRSSVEEETETGLYIKDFNKENHLRQHKESLIRVPYIQICELYNTYLGEVLGYKSELSQKERIGLEILWSQLENGLDILQTAFKKVYASSFLCGRKEGSKWYMTLSWLFRVENFNKVLAGKYDDFPGHIEGSSHKQEPSLSAKVKKFNQMYSHEWDFDEIERLERELIDRRLG